MNRYSPGLQWYADKLDNGERFSFVRYGNGEWDLILGLGTRTGSGSQHFTPDLRNAMRGTLLEAREGAYYTGLQSTTYLERLGLLPKAERWLKKNGIQRQWHNADVFHKASGKGQLYPLVEALHKHDVVVVGPPWLVKLPFTHTFIPVEAKDCWGSIGQIEAHLRGLSNVVVSFSAGPAAKVLIHRLYPALGKSCWLLDFGSLWDPFCGVNSRRYHRKLDKRTRRANLTGKA